MKFTDPNVETAAAKFHTLVKNGYFEPEALGVKYAESITNFTSGKTAMYPMGSWYLGAIPKTSGTTSALRGRPTTVRWSYRSRSAARWRSARGAGSGRRLLRRGWSLDPANFQSLISGDGAFPMLKDKTLANYDLDPEPGVQRDQLRRPRPERQGHLDRLGDKRRLDATKPQQRVLRGHPGALRLDDVLGQMQQLDSAWASATASS